MSRFGKQTWPLARLRRDSDATPTRLFFCVCVRVHVCVCARASQARLLPRLRLPLLHRGRGGQRGPRVQWVERDGDARARDAGGRVGGALRGASDVAARLRVRHGARARVADGRGRSGVAVRRVGRVQGARRAPRLRVPRHGRALVDAARLDAAVLLQPHVAGVVDDEPRRVVAHLPEQHRPGHVDGAGLLDGRVRVVVRAPVRRRVGVSGARLHGGVLDVQRRPVQLLRVPGHGRELDARGQELARGARRRARARVPARVLQDSVQPAQLDARVRDEARRGARALDPAAAEHGVLPQDVAAGRRRAARSAGQRAGARGAAARLLRGADAAGVRRAVRGRGDRRGAVVAFVAARRDGRQLPLLRRVALRVEVRLGGRPGQLDVVFGAGRDGRVV